MSNVVDLSALIASRRALEPRDQLTLDRMVDAGLLTDERPDGYTITAFGAAAGTFLAHHAMVYAQTHGMPMRTADDVGVAMVELEHVTKEHEPTCEICGDEGYVLEPEFQCSGEDHSCGEGCAVPVQVRCRCWAPPLRGLRTPVDPGDEPF